MLAVLVGETDLITKYKDIFLNKDIGISLLSVNQINTLYNINFNKYDLYRADILICLCSNDSLNSYMIKIGKNFFSIPNVISLCNNPNNYSTLISDGANTVLSIDLLIKNFINNSIYKLYKLGQNTLS